MSNDKKKLAGDALKPRKGYINTVNDASKTKIICNGKEVTPARPTGGEESSGNLPANKPADKQVSEDANPETEKTKDKKKKNPETL